METVLLGDAEDELVFAGADELGEIFGISFDTQFREHLAGAVVDDGFGIDEDAVHVEDDAEGEGLVLPIHSVSCRDLHVQSFNSELVLYTL